MSCFVEKEKTMSILQKKSLLTSAVSSRIHFWMRMRRCLLRLCLARRGAVPAQQRRRACPQPAARAAMAPR